MMFFMVGDFLMALFATTPSPLAAAAGHPFSLSPRARQYFPLEKEGEGGGFSLIRDIHGTLAFVGSARLLQRLFPFAFSLRAADRDSFPSSE